MQPRRQGIDRPTGGRREGHHNNHHHDGQHGNRAPRRAGNRRGGGNNGDQSERPAPARGGQPSDGPWRCDGPVLVTLVGDEPLAPLVLARQLDVCRVVCISPPVIEWRGEPLMGLLRRDGRDASWHSLSALDVPSGQRLLEAHVRLSHDEDVVFDLTNARGVLGLALYEMAHQRESETPDRCRLVRVDWSDRVVRSISPDQPEVEPLEANLDIRDYLQAHGKHVLGVERTPGSASPFGDAAYRLARSIPSARPLIEATHRGAPDHPLRIRRVRALSGLISGLEEDGVLEWRGNALFATSMRAFQFLHGRWLEEYLFEVAEASGRFDDCASGVRFRWSFSGEDTGGEGGGEVANEIDFVGTAHGRATLVGRQG